MQSLAFPKKLATIAAIIYVGVGFGLFLSAADNYLGKSGTVPIPSTVLATMFLLSIVAFSILTDFLTGRPTEIIGLVLRSNLAIIFPFGMLAFFSLVFALIPGAYWGDGRKWIYLQSYDFFIFLLAMLIPILPFIRNNFRFFVIVGLITILSSIFYEVQNPSTFSSVPNRAAGFPGNSNWGALVTVMITSMSLGYRDGASRILDIVIIAVVGLGLYFTLSRSGSMNFAMLIMFYSGITLYGSKNRVQTMATVLVAAVFLGAFFLVVVPMVSENSVLMNGGTKAESRLTSFFEGEVVDDGSADDRLEAARETLDRIEQSPLIGHGTGFNRRMRQTPHNLYLKLWVDSGIFGVVTWLLLLACGFWLFTSRKYRQGQGLILVTTLGGFFSHNILEQRTFLILLGAGATLSLYRSARTVQSIQRVSQAFPNISHDPEQTI